MSRIYKIIAEETWREAQVAGVFAGAGVDLADGFIHFSSREQFPETARRYFHGQEGLVALEVEADDLGPTLKWEPARGGELFPHLYDLLPVASVRAVHPLPLGPDRTPAMAPPAWLR